MKLNEYFENEVKEFETFVESRKKLESAPKPGDDNFCEVLKFNTYAAKRFQTISFQIEDQLLKAVESEFHSEKRQEMSMAKNEARKLATDLTMKTQS